MDVKAKVKLINQITAELLRSSQREYRCFYIITFVDGSICKFLCSHRRTRTMRSTIKRLSTGYGKKVDSVQLLETLPCRINYINTPR